MSAIPDDVRQQLRDLIVESLIGQATNLKQHLDDDAELVAAINAIEALKRLRRHAVAAAMDAQRLEKAKSNRGFRALYRKQISRGDD
jgi:ribonuclease HI